MPLRLHRGGRLRSWLGSRLGGDFELGDRIWRRALHVGGLIALLYYVVPAPLVPGIPNPDLLLAVLAAVLLAEAGRLRAGVEMPTIRPGETGRVASFVYFAVAIVLVILLAPRAIAVVAIVGTALVDPLLGELRRAGFHGWASGVGGWAAYTVLAVGILGGLARWPGAEVLAAGAAAAAVAVLAERPKIWYVDDDLLMTLAPAALLLVFTFRPA
ncbi:MAG: hypothetical protein ACREC5_04125 [Thermoplasmata archaeon]